MPSLDQGTTHPSHSLVIDYRVFANVPMPDESYPQRLYNPEDMDFQLRPGSAAIDAGSCCRPSLTDTKVVALILAPKPRLHRRRIVAQRRSLGEYNTAPLFGGWTLHIPCIDVPFEFRIDVCPCLVGLDAGKRTYVAVDRPYVLFEMAPTPSPDLEGPVATANLKQLLCSFIFSSSKKDATTL
jgi:hypothetical protein